MPPMPDPIDRDVERKLLPPMRPPERPPRPATAAEGSRRLSATANAIAKTPFLAAQRVCATRANAAVTRPTSATGSREGAVPPFARTMGESRGSREAAVTATAPRARQRWTDDIRALLQSAPANEEAREARRTAATRPVAAGATAREDTAADMIARDVSECRRWCRATEFGLGVREPGFLHCQPSVFDRIFLRISPGGFPMSLDITAR